MHETVCEKYQVLVMRNERHVNQGMGFFLLEEGDKEVFCRHQYLSFLPSQGYLPFFLVHTCKLQIVLPLLVKRSFPYIKIHCDKVQYLLLRVPKRDSHIVV